jgi:DoxX-like family
MNSLLWIVQILLAGVFFFTAGGKLFAYEKVVKVVESRSKGRAIGMSRVQAAVVAILEIVGALGLLMPVELFPPHLVILASAGWLAFLMVAATVYHIIRRESATPSIVLFLTALFIIVGRWPR